MKIYRIFKFNYKRIEENESTLTIDFQMKSITFNIIKKVELDNKELKRLIDVASPNREFFICRRDSKVTYHICINYKYVEIKPYKVGGLKCIYQ